ncbi:MAG: hypothetical protein P1U36_10325 [Legionellaceae bacterium]|nr:hypothetical protein [Legionellaceae bacterium]
MHTQINTAVYAQQEIITKLNQIEKEVNAINGAITARIFMDYEFCFLLPNSVVYSVLNQLASGYLNNRVEARINSIQPDANERYAMTRLLVNLNALLTRHSALFPMQNTTSTVITLINNTLNNSAINKLRPFLEVLKENITSINKTASSTTHLRPSGSIEFRGYGSMDV